MLMGLFLVSLSLDSDCKCWESTQNVSKTERPDPLSVKTSTETRTATHIRRAAFDVTFLVCPAKLAATQEYIIGVAGESVSNNFIQ